MLRKIKSAIEWVSAGQTVQPIAQYFWAIIPVSWTGTTGLAGVMTDQPVMWIMVAMAASAAFSGAAILSWTLYSFWKNPENKLRFVAPQVGLDFVGNKLSSSKRIDKAQIFVQIRNDFHFPLSVILERADSSIEGIKPPRGSFPKKASIIGPAAITLIGDEVIDMERRPCTDLEGEVDYHIRYGLPGKEKHLLPVKGTVSIRLDPSGALKGVMFHHTTEDIRFIGSSR